ncbi:MAG: signal peptidase I [Candidatus Kerfeldbacteria bacterium]|nr:signal peptidase I [Candidatus Kerfeldbacteria bacterium]
MSKFVKSSIAFRTTVISSLFFTTLKYILPVMFFMVIMRVFFITSFVVNGASMDPTLKNGDYLIVNQLPYYFFEPKRGDIIIFRDPKNQKTFDVKRIIGLPGETLSISQNSVFIEDVETHEQTQLSEPYVPAEAFMNKHMEIQLSKNEFFVMGDNRVKSIDSRYFGPIQRSRIIGRMQWKVPSILP